jgi:hypothetical protein
MPRRAAFMLAIVAVATATLFVGGITTPGLAVLAASAIALALSLLFTRRPTETIRTQTRAGKPAVHSPR